MAELSRSRGVGFRAARVVGLGESSTGCALALDDGSSVSTEMVVLGSGVRISELLPEYAETLVPMSDGLHGLGWGTDATGGVPGSIPFPSGKHVHKETTEELLCWRASSGHAAGVILARGPGAAQGRTGWARFSGPRFLLPGAGAGINFLKSGANEARSKLGSLFGFQKSALLPMAAKAARVQGLDAFLPDALEYVKSRDTSDFSLLGVDSLPCDELPLLGELGRWGRVLGGAGWLGCGYSAGWKTGSVLAEMVASGTCSDALGFLSPRRLKTQS